MSGWPAVPGSARRSSPCSTTPPSGCSTPQLWPEETTQAVLTALRGRPRDFGLPMALYTDRAGWAFHTPTAGGPVDRTHLTVVGRILARLGIEHIPSYSPQARGRIERLNRTLQGRLINELRVAGITTLEAANAYLRDQFIPDYHTAVHPPAGRSRERLRPTRRAPWTSISSWPRRASGSSAATMS